MVDEPFRARVAIKRRNWPLVIGATAPVVLAPLALALAIALHAPLAAGLALPLWGFGAIGMVYVWAKNLRALEQSADVEAGAEGVRVDGELALSRSAIREGFVVPSRTGKPIVRLVRKSLGEPLQILVDDEAQGRALLRALALDASQAVASFKLPSRLLSDKKYRLVTGIGLGVTIGLMRVLALSHAGAAGLFVLPFLLAFLVAMLVTPARLEVGADGIVTTWLGRKRFVGFGDVLAFKRYEDAGRRRRWWGLELELRSGELLRIPIGSRGALDDSHGLLIVERVREALDSYRRGDASAEASLLRRGARAVPDWVRALRGIGAGANAAHRTAPLDPERLWRVVEDPSAVPTARAGAAVALGVELDESSKQRLRAAADATASPKVRIAIEAAASEEDEAALGEALAAVEAEERGAGVGSA